MDYSAAARDTTVASYVTGGGLVVTGVSSGWTLSDWALIVGIATSIVTVIINLCFKIMERRDRLRRKEYEKQCKE